MVPSMMKRIVNEDLVMCRRVIQEKPVLTIDAIKKRCKRARQLLQDSGKRTPAKSASFQTKISLLLMP